MKTLFRSQKKIISIMVALLMCISFVGCGESNDGPDTLIGEAISGRNDAQAGQTTDQIIDSSNEQDAWETEGTGIENEGTDSAIEENTTDDLETGNIVSSDNADVVLGDERFDEYLPELYGKRVAVFTNQSGIVGDVVTDDDSEGDPDWVNFKYGEHITDALLSKGVNLSMIFSPEHGFSGSAGAGTSVGDSVLNGTNIAIVSLYGGTENALNEQNMSGFDTLLVDIQDVGLRFYTYYLTMYDLLCACAEYGKEVIILDRPNPNGFYVDGPILKDDFTSGVGKLPIPIVHGMTLGELALMMNGEGWLRTGKDSCNIRVITCENYKHSDHYDLIRNPSPNLKDMRAVYLYPSTCLFENTVVSVGRGTYHPFEIYGSPLLAGAIGFEYSFTPQSMEGAENPQYSGQACFGRSLMEADLENIFNEGIDLSYIQGAYNAVKATNPDVSFFGTPDGNGRYWIDLLCGTDEVRIMIEQGIDARDIEKSWEGDISVFREQRKPYLLYEDID